MQLGAGAVLVHEDLGFEFQGGGGARPPRAGSDLEAGVGAVARFAQQLGQGLRAGLDRVGGGVEQAAAGSMIGRPLSADSIAARRSAALEQVGWAGESAVTARLLVVRPVRG